MESLKCSLTAQNAEFLPSAQFCKLTNPLIITMCWYNVNKRFVVQCRQLHWLTERREIAMKWMTAFSDYRGSALSRLYNPDCLRMDILTSEKKESGFVSWFYLSWCFKLARLMNDITQCLKIVPSYIRTSYLAGTTFRRCVISLHLLHSWYGSKVPWLLRWNESIVPSHIGLENRTFHFPSVLVHDVSTEESSFK